MESENTIEGSRSSRYTNLTWAFSSNEYALGMLCHKHRASLSFLSALDTQIGDLRKHGCKHIVDRVKSIPTKDPNGCVRALASFHAEIIFALHFVGHGWRVEFVPENPLNATPDLLCELNEERLLVEITTLSEDAILETVLGFLRLLFRVLPSLHSVIHVDFKDELATPEVEKEDRYRQNCLVLTSISEFMRGLLRNYPEAIPKVIDTKGIVFSVEQSESHMGYPGIFNSGVIVVPTKKLQERVSSDLVRKANKQQRFQEGFEDLKYILAYKSGEPLLDDIDVEELLFGRRIFRHLKKNGYNGNLENEWREITESPERWIPQWDRIEEASRDGWEKLLKSKHLIPGDHTCLFDSGLFLGCPSMSNVTAVIMIHNSGVLNAYPNPFCRSEINLHGSIPNYLQGDMPEESEKPFETSQ